MPTAGMVFAYFHMLKIVRGHIGKIKIQRAQVGFNHDIVGRSGNVKTHESSSLNVIGAVILVFILCNFISIYRSLCLLVFPMANNRVTLASGVKFGPPRSNLISRKFAKFHPNLTRIARFCSLIYHFLEMYGRIVKLQSLWVLFVPK